MEQAEVEKLIGELEIGVDRLRSLYEQYFMGFEKLEPTVARKDVERRIHALRKEQIRNTALRFRFNMVIQRYNTYQPHWQRVCREIDKGIYKRHLVRAKQRFGEMPDAPPDERVAGGPPPSRAAEPSKPQSPSPTAQGPAAAAAALAAELEELDREFAPAPPSLGAGGPGRAMGPLPPASDRQPRRAPGAAGPAGSKAAWRKARTPIGPESPPVPSEASHPKGGVAAPSAAPVTLPPASRQAPLEKASSASSPSAPARRSIRPATSAPPASAGPRSSPASRPGPPAAQPSSPPSRSGGDLSESRLRQLYAQYVDAKRRGQESTAAITYEAVAQSLRDSSARLRQRHGKTVDFEVAIKDGKAVLRPVIK